MIARRFKLMPPKSFVHSCSRWYDARQNENMKKYVTPMKMDWSITPELTLVIDEKEKEVAAALGASQDLKIDIPCDEVQSNGIERGSDNALFNEREDIKVDKEEIELA